MPEVSNLVDYGVMGAMLAYFIWSQINSGKKFDEQLQKQRTEYLHDREVESATYRSERSLQTDRYDALQKSYTESQKELLLEFQKLTREVADVVAKNTAVSDQCILRMASIEEEIQMLRRHQSEKR